MASARKKQDEKNLKTLRELVSLPHNKYCFDCNQRGPTYVNVTIGSFVCTKCSGILRGITPPHRVKSISMATFTSEEIDFVRNRGNNYCRRTWLGLYEGVSSSEITDEQQIRDFMVEKYERKRYYMEPTAIKNGPSSQQKENTKQTENKSVKTSLTDIKPLKINGLNSYKNIKPQTTKNTDFVADFASADIFNATNNHNSSSSTQQGFADFDNNPVFTNTSMPSSLSLNGFTQTQNGLNTLNNGPPAPPEDKYAALKDLDNALKSQPSTLDWNSGSNSSLYSSATPGSLYSSPSPQSSLYGSPSQGQFSSMFNQQDQSISNPFNANNIWSNNNSSGIINNGSNPNPFNTTDPFKVNGMNGMNQNFQQMIFPQTVNGTSWVPNPFKVGTTNGHSNNPFL